MVTTKKRRVKLKGDSTPTLHESMLGVMRELRGESDCHLAKAQELGPRQGEIPVGGAHVDEFVRGEGLAAYLRGLGKGLSPEKAFDVAKSAARDIINNWNKKREYQVHRSLETVDTFLETAHRKVLASQKEKLK